jgi:hypothetical protein
MAKKASCDFRTVKNWHIIDNQHVHQLVKMNEIVDGVIAAMINELVNEFSELT